MDASRSVQSMARSRPSPSQTTINSPIGVGARSMRKRCVSGMKSSRIRCPKMLGGIGAPRPPRLRALEERRRRRPHAIGLARPAKQPDIACRESVGFAEDAERDVLRRPLADAGDAAEMA